jgi:tyrosyl-tRNA synthetase
MNYKSDFLNEISSRGFIYQSSDIEDLDALMLKKKITAYIGFDITSDSLHVGSLVQLMLLSWLDHYDHKPIALLGGATTLIGDPSGKDESRKILQLTDIENNIKTIKGTFSKFINLNKNGKVLNNYEWLADINYIKFLRDIGPKITINRMLNFESIKNRLDREQPLTFLEFNYMLLQAYDFYHLNKEYDCELQMGGSDQWGNIISGTDLIRRMSSNKTFAITSPLITNPDGTKMGKTVNGAIWLDENKLKNYDFYQFWRNIDDASVSKFLLLFTRLPIVEISKITKLRGQELNEAKKISNNLFTNKKLDDRVVNFSVKSEIILNSTFTLIDAIEKLGLIKSRSETKRLIKSNGVKINDENYFSNNFSLSDHANKNEIKITVGKKKIGIIKII